MEHADEYFRSDSILILGIVFAAIILIFGRFKGVNTLISLAFTVLAVFAVFCPVGTFRSEYLFMVDHHMYLYYCDDDALDQWCR